MSVDTIHEELKGRLGQYRTVRDAIEGDNAIKSGGVRYKSAPSGYSTAEYDEYINETVFENYTDRTLIGLTSKIFAKAIQVDTPKASSVFLQDMDLMGSTIEDISQAITEEVVSIGRCGVLVDMSNKDNSNITIQEAKKKNIRPYVSIYKSEDIINWRYADVNNKTTLVMVVLLESRAIWKDEFTQETETIRRVLKIEEGIYKQDIYIESTKGFIKEDEYYPQINGTNIDFIPFYIASSSKLNLTPTKPPLLEVARQNIKHYAQDVDFANGLVFTGRPMAYATGVSTSNGSDTFKMGSKEVKIFSNPNTKVGFLEFKAEGLKSLERGIATTKETIIVLGARFLETDKRVAETNSSLQTKASGDNAILTLIANNISRTLSSVLTFMNTWEGIDGQCTISLNTDFNLNTLDPTLLGKITEARALGYISSKTYFENLMKGEIISQSTTFEDYKTDLEEQNLNLSAQNE